MSVDWREVAERLRTYAREGGEEKLDAGQRASLVAIAARMDNGYRFTLLADEVGMGKTRIAAAVIAAVRETGRREPGRAVIEAQPPLSRLVQSRAELHILFC